MTAASCWERFPRAPLGHWPTPLERAGGLHEEVGGPRIWIKRDDCSGLATGGNKTRKLEFLIGRALHDGAEVVVTFGAVQSNHARQTAAACARWGLACELILVRNVDRTDPAYLGSGNVLLDTVLGASIHVAADEAEAFECFVDLAADHERAGRRLSVIPPGGSDEIGTLGYVAGGQELAGQIAAEGLDVDRVVVAASTGGTAAGLVVGLHCAGLEVPVEVACVYRSAEETDLAIDGLVATTADHLGVGRPPSDRWRTSDAPLGPGYGVPTVSGMRAIEVVARRLGLLLDPVYTGKAFAHLLDLVALGSVRSDRDIVFVHTGGVAGVFAYTDDLDGGAHLP